MLEPHLRKSSLFQYLHNVVTPSAKVDPALVLFCAEYFCRSITIVGIKGQWRSNAGMADDIVIAYIGSGVFQPTLPVPVGGECFVLCLHLGNVSVGV